MACRGRCFTAADNVHGKVVHHDDASSLGLTWYFCPAHKTFHALFLLAGTPQPMCGECAVLFFYRAPFAVWIRQYDLAAIMSNQVEVWQDAFSNMESHVLEMSRSHAHQRPRDQLLLPPNEPQSDILAEIPKDDVTYTSLSSTLIPHPRSPNFFLLEYRTFQGALAYQPCSKDIDTSGIFNALHPINRGGDPVFKQARAWSCIVQASEGLPKELRWVLATIYNFCNEMLHPDTDENELWCMRPWLMHWFAVADRLLDCFDVFATSPEIDWFQYTTTLHRNRENSAVDPGSRRDDSPRSSAGGTVVRHAVIGAPGSSATRAFPGARTESGSGRLALPQDRRRHPASAIHSWLASQPQLPAVDTTEIFDPTPGGFVSPTVYRTSLRDSQVLESERATSPAMISALNPEAAIFDPSMMPTCRPYSSLSTASSAEMDDTFDEPFKSMSNSESEDCSCYSSPNRRL